MACKLGKLAFLASCTKVAPPGSAICVVTAAREPALLPALAVRTLKEPLDKLVELERACEFAVNLAVNSR